MTAVLSLPHGGLELLPAWLRDADPRDGIRVRVDGTTTLHTGGLSEPSYRLDVLSEDCTLELLCDDALLRLYCSPEDDGALDAAGPGPRFGWTAEGFDRERRPQRIGARVGDALAACAGDPEALAAVAAITRWVADEAALRAAALGAQRDARSRRAAGAWRARGRALAAPLAGAGRLRLVPARPLRDEFVRQCARGELTAMELARRLGWHMQADHRPDGARVLRRLGLIAEPSARRRSGYDAMLSCGQLEVRAQLRAATACVAYETAVVLCRALGRDPAALGL